MTLHSTSQDTPEKQSCSDSSHVFLRYSHSDLVARIQTVFQDQEAAPLWDMLSASQTTYYPDRHGVQAPKHQWDWAVGYRCQNWLRVLQLLAGETVPSLQSL